MKAGNLKYRITINELTVTEDSHGQEIETLNPLATVWAGKWNLSTKDVTRQAGVGEQATGKFEIRYRDDITTSMVITFKGKNYKVTGTEDFEDKVSLFIFVRSIDG